MMRRISLRIVLFLLAASAITQEALEAALSKVAIPEETRDYA